MAIDPLHRIFATANTGLYFLKAMATRLYDTDNIRREIYLRI